jgi:5-methylcytosine-specific restriction endonuclease McrA
MNTHKRNFSSRQKIIMAVLSGNQCSICKVKLDKSFHGDHIRPWARGGKTILKNGQALCAQCNLRKGSK